MSRIIILSLYFISLSVFATSNYGTWSVKCNSDDAFNIILKDSDTPLVINHNQIIISIHSKKVSNDIEVYYNDIIDLGSGGMRLDWNNVSQSKAVANIILNENTGYMKWHGFFDKKTNTFFWNMEPDFVRNFEKNGIITIYRCDL
ncbi:hypothetical protein [Proteus mirabilis]|uniref:hypothetical protein n=1 Tax=Proteus mirabilis TaxID=584 RepID=UPI00235DCC03|nr:hypothetical protein [Proteus mirabilis]MDC9768161.1 hypothetical protein [Proteus mirabilis]